MTSGFIMTRMGIRPSVILVFGVIWLWAIPGVTGNPLPTHFLQHSESGSRFPFNIFDQRNSQVENSMGKKDVANVIEESGGQLRHGEIQTSSVDSQILTSGGSKTLQNVHNNTEILNSQTNSSEIKGALRITPVNSEKINTSSRRLSHPATYINLSENQNSRMELSQLDVNIPYQMVTSVVDPDSTFNQMADLGKKVLNGAGKVAGEVGKQLDNVKKQFKRVIGDDKNAGSSSYSNCDQYLLMVLSTILLFYSFKD